jgi:hypothetical protein
MATIVTISMPRPLQPGRSIDLRVKAFPATAVPSGSNWRRQAVKGQSPSSSVD